MKIEDRKVQELLLKGNYVSKEDMERADEYSSSHRSSAIDFLISSEIITRDLLGQAIAESYKHSYSDLNSNQPAKELVLKIPARIGRAYRAILYSIDGKNVTVTSDNPLAKNLKTKLQPLFKGKKIKITYSLPEDIEASLVNYRKALETRFAKIIKRQGRVAPEIIDEILADAIIYNASDIHFEPQDDEDVIIRFRIDGVLQEAGSVEKKYYNSILNRIKVQSHLRTDEHFAAQDGAMRVDHKTGGQVDIRVSIVPTLDGEKVTMRILAENVRTFSLADLGLAGDDQEYLSTASKKPFGMILVTGPTGSGKTTTLYATLKYINSPTINITTIEDPVEYKITGVNHIQINNQTGLTFPNGLRSIVRQDPDVILVGEIRDTETAEISVNAALTGHLLLSTFHANDAATSIPRLLNMGIEPFLLASTLEIILAQRLARRICQSCRYSYSITKKELKDLRPHEDLVRFMPKRAAKWTVYKGKGCDACRDTGYSGRLGIFEIIHSTQELKALIMKNPSSQEVWKLAKKQGTKSMYEDGIDKVMAGVTTIDELLRVAEPPE